MKIKTLIISLLSFYIFAGGGTDLGGWRIGGGVSTTFRGGSGDLGGLKIGQNTNDIVTYFDNLNSKEKSKKLLELPKQVKIHIDRDFISPINRWTSKTKNRELLAKDYDQIITFDELNEAVVLFGEELESNELKTTGFSNKDF